MAKIRELEKNWKDEIHRSKTQQESWDLQRNKYEKTITDLRDQIDDTSEEKDSKIAELNNQVRNHQKTQRDALNKARLESESILNK